MRVNRFARAEESGRPANRPDNICGVLVHARPDDRFGVAERLEALPGVEVHVTGDDGKLIVTVEDTADSLAGVTIEGFIHVPGVLAVALAYHHFDSELEGEIVP